MESSEKSPLENKDEKSKFTDELKNFYKGELKQLFMTFFRDPIDGILTIFKNPSDKVYTNSLILYGSVFLLYFIGSIILSGESRKYIDFFVFFKIGFIPIIMMSLISMLSFFIKSISGKSDFKNELQTGGICGIPLSLIVFLALIFRLFSGDNIMQIVYNPVSAGSMTLFFIIYILLMIINVFQQSLRASNIKNALAWYLSPVSILFSIYLTFHISKAIF
jgi:hypothetical protein